MFFYLFSFLCNRDETSNLKFCERNLIWEIFVIWIERWRPYRIDFARFIAIDLVKTFRTHLLNFHDIAIIDLLYIMKSRCFYCFQNEDKTVVCFNFRLLFSRNQNRLIYTRNTFNLIQFAPYTDNLNDRNSDRQ